MRIDPEELYALLLGLFRSEGELQRFLVLEGYPVQSLIPVTKASSTLSAAVSEVSRRLVEQGLVDERFFAALRRRTPDRVADIDAVARTATAEGPLGSAEPSAEPESPLDPDVAELLVLLRADLADLRRPDPFASALTPEHWPWVGAAAVLGPFRPAPVASAKPADPVELALLPLFPPDRSAPSALAGFVDTVAEGRWLLRDEIRIPALRKLDQDDVMTVALSANAELSDPQRDTLDDLVADRPMHLASLDTQQLEDLDRALGWLEQIGRAPSVRRVDVHAFAERRRLIDPLRTLVGEHFRGRGKELAQVRDHLRPTTKADPILRLHGVGGVGKSSLIGRVLLDLEKARDDDPRPFAYVDFDRMLHDPLNLVGLVEQIAKQLRLLYASTADALGFAALESASGGTDAARAAELLQIEPGHDLGALIDVLAWSLRQIEEGRGNPQVASLILVLDTFEEVQVKGLGPVRQIMKLIDQLRNELPTLRVIIAGRSVNTLPGPGTTLELGDLDPVAADAVLAQRGVSDSAVRAMVIDRFGGNPLTLRLAADALSRIDSAELAFGGIVAESDAVAEVAKQQIQGMLYSRILGHIRDPEVVRVAHPGLAVRLVTVEVLRDVLAVPCGLDPGRASSIFDRLRHEVSMFEWVDADTLRHREDVRQLMLRMMAQDPALAGKVLDIHRRAAAFYAGRPTAADKAEELYHRLMSGDNPRGLDMLWRQARPAQRPPSLEEPLPRRARAWLERRLGLVADGGRDDWDQEDWEAEAAERAASWLASGDPRQALAVLDERVARMPGSQLPAYEVAATTALGQFDRARGVLDEAMRSAIQDQDLAAQLNLAEQAVELAARQDDPSALLTGAQTAAAIADLTGEPVRAMNILVRAIVALRHAGRPEDAAQLCPALAGRFRLLGRAALREAPDLVRRVLRGAGTLDPVLVLHAAQYVGDLTEEIFVPDAYALGRLLAGTTAEAGPAMQALAQRLGMTTFDHVEMASRAVRLGLVGEVVRIGLDYAQDLAGASILVTRELIHPPAKEETDGIPLPR